MQDLFSRFTLDAAGEFLFGTRSLNSLELPFALPGRAKLGPKGTELEGAYGSFVSAFDEIQNVISLRYERNWFWPLIEFWRDETKEHRRVMNDFITPLIKEAIFAKKSRYDKPLDTGECSFLDYLVHSTEDEKLIRDQVSGCFTMMKAGVSHVMFELINMLVAARDTTATLLTFLTYLLATHPHVLEKLRHEVTSIAAGQAPTYEIIGNMKYRKETT